MAVTTVETIKSKEDSTGTIHETKALCLGNQSPASVAVAAALNALLPGFLAKLPNAVEAANAKGSGLDADFEAQAMTRRIERAISAFYSDAAPKQVLEENLEKAGIRFPATTRGRKAGVAVSEFDV